jgi:hypothetical protein
VRQDEEKDLDGTIVQVFPLPSSGSGVAEWILVFRWWCGEVACRSSPWGGGVERVIES